MNAANSNMLQNIGWNSLHSYFRFQRFHHDRHNTYRSCTSKSYNHSYRLTTSIFRRALLVVIAIAPFLGVSPTVTETIFPSVSDLYPGTSGGADGPFDLELPIHVTLAVLEPPSEWFLTLPMVVPVMDLAVADMNEKYRGRIKFGYAWGLGSCDRDVVGVEAARLSCSHNISVFIGPGGYITSPNFASCNRHLDILRVHPSAAVFRL